MKFTLFDKFLLVLLLLAAIALSALCIATAMDFVSYDMIVAPIAVITNGIIGNRLILGAAGVVLLTIALRLFVAMGKKRQPQMAPAPTSTLLLSNDNGTAYITIAAIDSLVQRHCCANGKIRECESLVAPAQEPNTGVCIKLRLSVTPETVIPELTASLQQSLKEYIQGVCGVSVNSVDILILPMQQPRIPKTI